MRDVGVGEVHTITAVVTYGDSYGCPRRQLWMHTVVAVDATATAVDTKGDNPAANTPAAVCAQAATERFVCAQADSGRDQTAAARLASRNCTTAEYALNTYTI